MTMESVMKSIPCVKIRTMSPCLVSMIFLVFYLISEVYSSPWSTWWSYSGHAGPKRWGYLNPDWLLCRSGKFQSPIDIDPRLLLFDPRLRRMRHEIPPKVDGTFKNSGNDLTFWIDDVIMGGTNFSGGPLLYGYRAFQIKIHIGDTNKDGSEHKIDGKGFAAEVQILCYNTNLFKSHGQAWRKPYGIAILSIMAEIRQEVDGVPNGPFEHLVTMATRIPHQEQSVRIENFDLKGLIPNAMFYVTYEGSMTQPGCHETVTWVLFNKPVFIQASQLDTLRDLQTSQKDQRMTMSGGNLRPVTPVNNRVIRTNINYPYTGGLCDMRKVTFYEANDAVMG